jgi:hypothetical protein
VNDRSDEAVLCVWNRSFYSELCNKPGVTAVFDEIRLRQALAGHAPRAMVLLAELTWPGHDAGFYGLELLCQLRADLALSCPVAVASFMPFTWLRQRYPILDFAGQHPFIRLPALPDEIVGVARSGKPADPFRLRDMVSSCCDPRGRFIKLVTHGPGLRNLARCLGSLSAKELAAVQDDCRLLQQYLQHSFLEKNIEQPARELLDHLQRLLLEANTDHITNAQQAVQRLTRML